MFDIILIPQATFVPNFVSVATSVAELARRENRVINHPVTHSPAYLMPREPKLSLWNIFKEPTDVSDTTHTCMALPIYAKQHSELRAPHLGDAAQADYGPKDFTTHTVASLCVIC